MTQEIIEMAQECGLIGMRPHLDGIYSEALEAFAKLVAEKAVAIEREACAKECWKQMGLLPTQAWEVNPYEQCIDAIRARGQA
jgi:hypothetical protein